MNYEQLKQRICIDRIRQDMEYYACFDKVAGTPGGEKGASFIYSRLREAGIDCKMEQFEEYLSTPLHSTVEVPASGLVIESTPRSTSGSCTNLEGELVFDPAEGDLIVISKEREAFLETLRGKIVLTYTDNEFYPKVMERYGIKALLYAWPCDDPLRNDTCGAVWGTPTTDTYVTSTLMPVIGITYQGSLKLLELMNQGPVTVRLSAELDTSVHTVSMPMCEIPGKTKDFVLLSCHYDTWDNGAFDNSAANCAAIELARVFFQYRDELQRSIRIVWWAGHSNGRYAGSTWYCDNYWQDIREHCVANFTADLLGCKAGEIIGISTAGMEGKAFLEGAVHAVDPGVLIRYNRLGRRGEQSFFGAEVPLNFYLRYEIAPEKRTSTAPGGSWWWHTKFDTIDKVGFPVLERETQMWYLIANRLANDARLPFDGEAVFSLLLQELKAADEASEDEFSFAPIILELEKVRDTALTALAAAKDDSTYNSIVRVTAGTLNRLRQTYGARYSQDLAYDGGLFPRLAFVAGKKKEEVSPKHYLFMRTDFIRRRNQMLEDLPELCSKIKMLSK